jgi:hypothetical protein
LMIVQRERADSSRRAYFTADMARVSDVVLRLEGEHTFTIERHSHPALPQLASIPTEIAARPLRTRGAVAAGRETSHGGAVSHSLTALRAAEPRIQTSEPAREGTT